MFFYVFIILVFFVLVNFFRKYQCTMHPLYPYMYE